MFFCAASATFSRSRFGAASRTPPRPCEALRFALVRIGHHCVLNLLVDLLADPEKDARVSAAQALAYNATQAAGLLLRLKARIGDKAPEVISECLGGLLKLDAQEGLPFVAEFLQSADEAIQESAAIALGESRRPEAFPVLKDFWEHQIVSTMQETILVAMALLRLPAANDFLLSLISDGSSAVAAAALSALAVHRHDARLRDRVAAAVAETGSAALRLNSKTAFASATPAAWYIRGTYSNVWNRIDATFMKIVLAFEGMDGSGKTSLALFTRELCEEHNQRYTLLGRREAYASPLVGRLTGLLHEEAANLRAAGGHCRPSSTRISARPWPQPPPRASSFSTVLF